jgi:rhamnulokinase
MKDMSLLAFDLGAGSGRALLGTLTAERLSVKEISRFRNDMVELRGRLYWNVVHLFKEVLSGLSAYGSGESSSLESIGVDAWGVDFALLGADGSLLGLPVCYRDRRTEGAIEGFLERLPRKRVYELTGLQFLPLNTLFQLFAMVRDESPLLEVATDLLFMPDLINYLLTGEKKNELTVASTSQLYDPRRREWAGEIFEALGIQPAIMQDIVEPGTAIGTLDERVAASTGAPAVPVVATASHDTAAAVAAVPAEGRDWAYISSGTWSLMGVESEAPIITDDALALNFTNEAGIGGTSRVLKNIAGLWLLEQCRKAWERERPCTHEELINMAGASSFDSFIDPDHGSFLNPTDMPEAIRSFCRNRRQGEPNDAGDFARCIFASLALKYRLVLDQVRRIYSPPINRIHIIGGGARNRLLCQLTADATGLPVLAGPAEATAIGNILVQAMGLGRIRSHWELREIVRASFRVAHYEPRSTPEWDSRYDRFCEVCA